MFLSECIPAVTYFSMLFFVGKSPRWLVKNGESEAAREVIREVNPDADIDKMLKDIELSLMQETSSKKASILQKNIRPWCL